MRIRSHLMHVAGAVGLFFAGISLAVLPGSGLDVHAQSSPRSFTPTADAYVSSASPNSNRATSSSLRVDGSPLVMSYLRFDVQDLSGAVTKATLLIFTASSSSTGFDVHEVADTSWQETAVTFATAPPMGKTVTSSGPFTAGVWTQVDVTSAVAGNGSYSFGLTTSSKRQMNLASRETTTSPQLLIETDDSSTPAATAAVATTAPPTTTATDPTGAAGQPSFPIRAAFYYPWFPEAWNQQGLSPFTRYTPSLGLYDGSASVIQAHIGAMATAGLTAGIASWWGQGSRTDARFGQLLAGSNALGLAFKWAVYYEPEGTGDPTVEQVRADLAYIAAQYTDDPAYLRVAGRPVIFVYNADDLTCSIVDKWTSANTDFYVDLKVFTGYRLCGNQPDSWHQYGPAVAVSHQAGYSYSISPGFFKANESTARLARDPGRWAVGVRDMVASGEPWQLVTTFNEWGEGTSVESAAEWQSSSGAGTYLDALRLGIGGAPTSTPPPAPPSATTTATPPETTSTSPPPTTGAMIFGPSDDATIKETRPTSSYGTASTLEVDADSRKDILLRFDVSGLGTASVARATLRLFALDPSPFGGAFSIVTDSAWTETGVTWTTAPAGSGGSLGSLGSVSTGGWYELDVTGLVEADGPVSIRISSTNANGADYASKENSNGNAPQLVVLTGDSSASPEPATTTPDMTTTSPSGTDPVVLAAGDIACDPTSSSFNGGNGTSNSCRQKWTSDLFQAVDPTAILTLGDNQYEDGSYSAYLGSFDPSWGRKKSIIHPGIGNHEYLTPGATGYFQYFGAAAGDPAKGYYSFDVGSWHMIALNSECSHVGGCGAGSAQEQWLKADIAAHPAGCTLAYWHEPRFSSGQHGDAQQMAVIWNDLVAANADVVLSGHNHVYERFDPLGATPQGSPGTSASPSYQEPVLDPTGIRMFVVGTGGKNHYGFGTQPPLAGEVVRDSSTYGVLKLTLHPAGYDWQFVNDPGSGTFTDSGSGSCH